MTLSIHHPIKRDSLFALMNRLVIGQHEWCQLPKLHLPAIKAKIDTGAKTSAIHAFDIKCFTKKRKEFVRFSVHPLQNDTVTTVRCQAPIIDQRSVMSSNGHKEDRYVIKTPLCLGDCQWDIELTLSNRDPLKFRMLLGLQALEQYTLIFPHKKNCLGRKKPAEVKKLYP